MTDLTNWHEYKPVSLTQPDYPDPLELLLRDPRPFEPEPSADDDRPSDRTLGVVAVSLACLTVPLFFYAAYVALERLLG